MSGVRSLGRLGLLAVGLGVGAAVASTPGIAAADTAVDPFALDLNDIAISLDGTTLFQEGTATANSGMGDFAIAMGAGSQANAGAGLAFGQTLAPGDFEVAIANGTGSFASAGKAATSLSTSCRRSSVTARALLRYRRQQLPARHRVVLSVLASLSS